MRALAHEKFEACFGQPAPEDFREAWVECFNAARQLDAKARKLAHAFGQAPVKARRQCEAFLREQGVDPREPMGNLDAFFRLSPVARELAFHVSSARNEPYSLRDSRRSNASYGRMSVVTDIIAYAVANFEIGYIDVGGEGWELTPGSSTRRRHKTVVLSDAELASVVVILDRMTVRITDDDASNGTLTSVLFNRVVLKVRKARKTHGEPSADIPARASSEHPEIPMPRRGRPRS